MLARGYPREFAERCFDQIKGFSEYGFPESHAASFAHLVYVSAWLKCHYPAAFGAALLNSQPMGFYAPAQIVRDAQEHGVEVRSVDVNWSEWDCTLEERHEGTEARRYEERDAVEPHCHHIATSPDHHITKSHVPSVPLCLCGCISDSPALRLGMRQVRGLREEDGRAVADAVNRCGPFQTIEELRHHSGMRLSALKKLAAADAFRSMNLDRQHALWMLRELRDEELPLFDGGRHEGTEPRRHEERDDETKRRRDEVLPSVTPARQVIQDYFSVGLSLKAHPISFIREELNARRITRNLELKDEKRWPNGKQIAVAGLTLVRQRPGTASGIVFITIEDETGIANLIVRPKIYDKFRKAARHATMTILLARGKVERQGEVVHVMVRSMEALDESLRDIVTRSRDFH
jgi:error-prone DNA polymerase